MNWRRALRRAIIAWNVLAPLLAIGLLCLGRPWWALAAITTAHALWLIPTLIPACGWCGPVVTSVPAARPQDRTVWLTIDDGPHPEDTPRLLDLLEAYHARATFFFIGAHAARHPDLVREVIRRGHEVANHTMNHVQYRYWAFGPGGVRREIDDCQRTLFEITGAAPRWFRAPAGLKNPLVQAHLERLGLGLAGWSARGLDGVITDPARVLARMAPDLRPGAIILMHEGRVADNGERLAPQVLSALLARLDEAGLRCVVPS